MWERKWCVPYRAFTRRPLILRFAGSFRERIPPSHAIFSRLEFSQNTSGLAELGENEDEGDDAVVIEPEDRPRPVLADTPTDMPTGVSLSDDEIEDW